MSESHKEIRSVEKILPSLEKKFQNLSVVIDGSTTPAELAQRIADRGGSLALCINTKRKEMYIGDDHRSMYENHRIPDENYFSGIVKYDPKIMRTVIDVLIDSRPEAVRGYDDSNEITDAKIKDLIATKLHEVLFREES